MVYNPATWIKASRFELLQPIRDFAACKTNLFSLSPHAIQTCSTLGGYLMGDLAEVATDRLGCTILTLGLDGKHRYLGVIYDVR